VSVGFDPIEVEPNGKGGYNFNKWELLELSIVSVPANPGATVFARAFGQDDRLLAAAHADALMRAHRRIGAARQDVADVLQAVGHPPADDGDGYDPEAEALSFDAARKKRARAAALMSLDCVHVGPAAKPSAPPRELRGGLWLTAHVREQEAARLRKFWSLPV
jgi:hypothetical protein